MSVGQLLIRSDAQLVPSWRSARGLPARQIARTRQRRGVGKTRSSVADNYRLIGAQTDFTDDTGRPIILGNSVTEAGFQTTSSCITCHGRASVTSSGSPGLSVFNPQGQSFNGPLQAGWYFGTNGVQNNFTTDFMWSMTFCAAADASSNSGCQ